MASYESKRTYAYSDDMRWRMVWQSQALGLKFSQIAANLGVDAVTVWRVVKLFTQTGDVKKKAYPCRPCKITPAVQFSIAHTVLRRPGIYLRELQSEIAEEHGEELSLSAICRFLHKSGFTRQKLRMVATQRDSLLRSQFVLDISFYTPEMLIFIDEAGSDRRDCIRRYGYSLRGKPLVSQRLHFRGERIKCIAFMSMAGLLDCRAMACTVDGDKFYDFIQVSLLPHLMPFDGYNPHSIVIMDNCSIHHVPGVVEMIQEVGALVHFLPPYSPDYNPIEEAFSKVKTNLKAMDLEAESSEDTENLVLASFSTITREDCQQWIANAGIYNTIVNA